MADLKRCPKCGKDVEVANDVVQPHEKSGKKLSFTSNPSDRCEGSGTRWAG